MPRTRHRRAPRVRPPGAPAALRLAAPPAAAVALAAVPAPALAASGEPGFQVFPGGNSTLLVLLALLVLFVAGGFLLAYLGRGARRRDQERAWWRQLLRVAPDARFLRDLLHSAAGGDPDDAARWESARREFDRVELELAALASRAPDAAHARPVQHVRQTLLDLRFAVEGDRVLRTAPEKPSEEQLAETAAEVERAARAVGQALTELSHEPG